MHCSIEEGLRQQALNRAQRVRKHTSDTDMIHRHDGGSLSATSTENTPRKKQKPYSDDSSTENSLLEAEPPQPETPLSEIELVFKPYPKDANDKTEESRYIKTTANATGINFFGS